MSSTNDEEFAKNIFNQVMSVFVAPELRKRLDAGTMDASTELRAAQVIFSPEMRLSEVRINKEIKSIASVKLKQGVSKQKDELVYAHEIEGLENIDTTPEDADAGHITLFRLNDRWIISFCFIPNRDTSRKLIAVSKQFFEAAKHSHDKKNWNAFVDNLYSACELVAYATLLGYPPEQKVTKNKASHNSIQTGYNRMLLNVDQNHRDSLNKLSGLRTAARYNKGELKVDESKFREYMETVNKMIEDIEKTVS